MLWKEGEDGKNEAKAVLKSPEGRNRRTKDPPVYG